MSIMKGDASTINFYNKNHENYDNDTSQLELKEQWKIFESRIRPGGKILDIGCGSGRDITHFQTRGFSVEGLEPSTAMAEMARKRTNARIYIQPAEQLCANNQYDGIWACASLLHISKKNIKETIQRIAQALNKNGHAYISVKSGSGELRKEDGRLFSNYSSEELKEIISTIPEIVIVTLWTTPDAAQREDLEWINLLLKKI